MTLLIVPVEFLFRYLLVCKNYKLSVRQLVGLGFLTFLLGLLNSCLAIASLTSTSDARGQYAHLMTDAMWLEQNGQQLTFVAVERSNPLLFAFLASSGMYNAGSCVAVTFLGLATFRSLKNVTAMTTERTRKMQAQMNRILMTEALSVLLVINLPIGGLLFALFFDVNIVGWGIAMTMVFTWIPVLNPITTICLVDSYRHSALNGLKMLSRRRLRTHQVSDDAMNET